MFLKQRLAAEFIGTYWFVFGGGGSAVLASALPKEYSPSKEDVWAGGLTQPHSGGFRSVSQTSKFLAALTNGEPRLGYQSLFGVADSFRKEKRATTHAKKHSSAHDSLFFTPLDSDAPRVLIHLATVRRTFLVNVQAAPR